MPTSSTRAASRWTSRILPLAMAGIVGFATFIFVDRLCNTYLLETKNKTGLVIALLILYFLFLLLSVGTYVRLLLVIKRDAGIVPLSAEGEWARANRKQSQPPTVGGDPALTFESVRYDMRQEGEGSRRVTGSNEDVEANGSISLPPQAPGLNLFYTKDAFVCESDGRPRWCPDCLTYKPDRAHHSSELDRCVYKMDHYCPWVGGMVAEKSFKFFVQFNFYATLYCAVVLGASAYGLKMQVSEKSRTSPLDSLIIVLVALSSFFGLFAFMMLFNTVRFVLLNLTQVDALTSSTKVYQLAVHVDRNAVQSDGRFKLVTYPLAPLPTPVPMQEHGRRQEQGQIQAQSQQQTGGQWQGNDVGKTQPNGSTPSSPNRHHDHISHTTTATVNTGTTAPFAKASDATENLEYNKDKVTSLEEEETQPSHRHCHYQGESGSDQLLETPVPRTFAILKTEPGESPWDLGWRHNFLSVMGTNPLDWLFPLKESPCANRYGRKDGFYEMGPLIHRLRKRNGLEKPLDEKGTLLHSFNEAS